MLDAPRRLCCLIPQPLISPASLQATLIFKNGAILTMDSRCSIVSCLAVSGETILAVGSETEVAPFQGPETRITDLGGRFMKPGF